ncbi:zinc-ribbon domain-containing protein [Flavobacteriaceae bacterium]|mgnify:CR=1 FL=1|nr:zinc-ribbon domain-containing protein [Flavobacteriaceae bacterium]
MATTHPELANQWHPTKNGDSNPYNIGGGSGKRFWWRCDKGDDHEWITSPSNRINKGAACAICINQKIVKSNCLATTHPELANQWHPTKNGDLTPFDVGGGTNKKVWWKCDKGDDHEWITSASGRSGKRGCPFCTLTPQSNKNL